MSRFLLDTDVLIDYAKGREPARSRIQQMIAQGDDLGVCAVNVAEFFTGLAPADRAYWQRVFATLSYWDVSALAAQRAGEIRYDAARQGQALATADALIAAVAMEQQATLATNNTRHFTLPGLQVLALR